MNEKMTAVVEIGRSNYLAVDKSGDGHVPSSVSGHPKPQKGPKPVVMERRDENSGSTTSSKNISPCSLVQMIIDVINIADEKTKQTLNNKANSDKIKRKEMQKGKKKKKKCPTLHKQ